MALLPTAAASAVTNARTSNAPRENAVQKLLLDALNGLKAFENNGKRGTPPPMVARDMFYISSAIAEVYQNHGDDPKAAARIASAVTAQLTNGLVGKEVMPVTDRTGGATVKKWLDLARADRAPQAGQPRAPTDPMGQVWSATNEAGLPVAPLLPSFGLVKPCTEANKTVRAVKPTFSDAQWRQYFSDYEQRTPEQKASAKYWADGPGSVTPPGHWNVIASKAMSAAGLTVQQSAELAKLVNSANFDAGIAAWDAKYQYAGERPFQAAKRLGIAFTPQLGTPPFPGYVSGHATFSAAAAQVLGRYFDELSQVNKLKDVCLGFAQTAACRRAISGATNCVEMFEALAKEASDSRLHGGIHIGADGSAGMELGKQIGENVFLARQRR